jgi:hypothetical protein
VIEKIFSTLERIQQRKDNKVFISREDEAESSMIEGANWCLLRTEGRDQGMTDINLYKHGVKQ